MAIRTYSIVIEIEVDEADGIIELPTIEELEEATSKFCEERFASDVMYIEAADGTLANEFGIEYDEE